MTTVDSALRSMVAELVRAEVKRVLESAADASLLTTRAAARQADVAPSTIRRWVREGRLAARKVGHTLRINRADLDKLLKGSAAKNDASPEQLARAQFGG